MNQAKIQSSAGIASPAETTLKLVFSIRKCLKFSTRFENGESFVSVEDPVRSKHYRIGLAEYRFIAKINGERSNANIFELLKNETGAQQGQQQASNELPQDQIVQIANWLLAMNLVTVNQSDNSLRLNAMAQQIYSACDRMVVFELVFCALGDDWSLFVSMFSRQLAAGICVFG